VPLRAADPGASLVYSSRHRNVVREPPRILFVAWGRSLVFDAACPAVFARYAAEAEAAAADAARAVADAAAALAAAAAAPSAGGAVGVGGTDGDGAAPLAAARVGLSVSWADGVAQAVGPG